MDRAPGAARAPLPPVPILSSVHLLPGKPICTGQELKAGPMKANGRPQMSLRADEHGSALFTTGVGQTDGFVGGAGPNLALARRTRWARANLS